MLNIWRLGYASCSYLFLSDPSALNWGIWVLDMQSTGCKVWAITDLILSSRISILISALRFPCAGINIVLTTFQHTSKSLILYLGWADHASNKIWSQSLIMFMPNVSSLITILLSSENLYKYTIHEHFPLHCISFFCFRRTS